MNHGKRVLVLIILIAIVIASTAFILGNSLMDRDSSHGTSGVITSIVTDTEDEYEWDRVDLIVRKIAHLVEYAVLGACGSLLCVFIHSLYGSKIYCYLISYSLFIAVLDEHIQSFSDRGSSTSDILLDFLGSIIGFASVIAIYFAIAYFIKKNRKNNAQPN